MDVIITGLDGQDGADGVAPGESGGRGSSGEAALATNTTSPDALNSATATGGAGGRGGRGADGSRDDQGAFNGPGGDAGASGSGGAATATVRTTAAGGGLSTAIGTAQGGAGADFGRAGPGAPGGLIGNGRAGGQATAEAFDVAATRVAKATATAVGGAGGQALTSRSAAGSGGAAVASAHAESSRAGAEVWASVNQTGGNGGLGARGAGAGNGASSLLKNAATAQANEGTIHLSQTAVGGSGGTTTGDSHGRTGRGGSGGTATAILVAQDSDDIVYGADVARAGDAGQGRGPSLGRAGAAAFARTILTGGQAATGSSEAYAGRGGGATFNADGGAGGSAIAVSRVVSQGASTATAIAVGGGAGAGSGVGYVGGAGGVARASASAIGVTAATATVIQTGGEGGWGGYGGDHGGDGVDGADSRLVNAVTGSTQGGILTLTQTARGGRGGVGERRWAGEWATKSGQGGAATSILILDDTLGSSQSAVVNGTAESVGGEAGSAYNTTLPARGGGEAVSRIAITAAQAGSIARATGGRGPYNDFGVDAEHGGGAASATATARSMAQLASASAEAYAHGGETGYHQGPAPNDGGGNATATAKSFGFAATALAVAYGGGGSEGQYVSGGGGNATAAAISKGSTANARADAHAGKSGDESSGGVATASAEAIGTGSGASYATANVYGGDSYWYGSASAAAAINAVSGVTNGGPLYLSQNAYGGGCGSSLDAELGGGDGGDAVSRLVADDTQAATHSVLLNVVVTATGGSAHDSGYYSYGGDGGSAVASVKAVGLGDVTASSKAVGGLGVSAGYHNPQVHFGGDAVASTTVETQGVADASADAEAGANSTQPGAARAVVNVTGSSGKFSSLASTATRPVEHIESPAVMSVSASVRGVVNGFSRGVASAHFGGEIPGFTTDPQATAVLAGSPEVTAYQGLLAANSNLSAAFGPTPVIFGLAELGGRHSAGGTGGSQTTTSEIDITIDLTKLAARQDLVFGFAHGTVLGGASFTGLTVDVFAGESSLLHESFDTAAAAQAFFTNDAVDLGSMASGAGPLGGSTLALRVVISVSSSAEGGGFFGEVVFGEAPPAPSSAAPSAHRFVEAMAGFGSHGGGAIHSPTAGADHAARVSLFAHRTMAHA